MTIKKELSLSEQKKGRISLLSFSFLNGMALTFIGGNVLSLYLLLFGFSATIVAIITSFTYAGALFAFSGKWFIANFGASLTVRISWIFCGFSAICLSLVPFTYYEGYTTKNEMLLLIIIIILILYIFKAIGTSAIPPLMGEFTDKGNQGRFSSKFFLLYNFSTILAILSLIFLYSGFKTIFIFQILIFVSGIIKLLSSFIFAKMHETSMPTQSAKILETHKSLFLIWNTTEYRNFLIFRSLARAGLILIIPISILALKTTYNVPDQTALIFTLIQLLGGLFITYLFGVIADYTGPKPLIIINILILFIICFLWVYSPLNFVWIYCAVIFFIGGICLFGLDSSINHYYLSIIPRKHSVGISLWFTTICGTIAGISGIIIAGGLIKIYSLLAVQADVFIYYYASMLILLVPILYFSCTLKTSSKDEWSVSNVVKLMLTPLKIYSLFSLGTENKYSSSDAELEFVNKLRGISSELSEKHLVYYLESPDFFVSSSAIMAMNIIELEENSKKAIYKVLKSPSHVNPLESSIILAKNNFTKALPLFRKRLKDSNITIKGSSMIALAMMKDEISYSRIIDIFIDSKEPHLVVFGAKALAIIKDINTLDCMLNKLTWSYCEKNTDLTSEIVLTIAKIISCNEIYYKYIRLYKHDKNKGLLRLLDIIEENSVSQLTQTPESMLRYYYKNRDDYERKISFINYLKEALNRDNMEMQGLKIFHDYLIKTDPNIISEKLLTIIFIKIFC